MTRKYKLDKEELLSVVKVFVWAFGSAIIAGLIAVVSSVDVPNEWLIYIPVINTFLYGAKTWFADNR